MSLIVSLRRRSETEAATDPIIAIGNLEAWWDRDGIDPSATVDGNNVDTWTDRIGGRVLNKVTGTQPKLEVNASLRAVRFDGTNAMRIAEWAAVDFVGMTDAYTIIAKTGNDAGTIGTLVGKQFDGAKEIQYQLAISPPNGTTIGKFHHTLGGAATSADTFTRHVIASPPLVANKVFAVTVGTANNNDTVAYYDNEVPSVDFEPPEKRIGTNTNNYDIYVGARWAGTGDTLGFQFDGSIAHVLFFSKKLSSSEIATVVANLD